MLQDSFWIKETRKAVDRVKENFCPNCKKKMCCLVSDKDNLELTKKIGRRRFKKVRCANFKRRPDEK